MPYAAQGAIALKYALLCGAAFLLASCGSRKREDIDAPPSAAPNQASKVSFKSAAGSQDQMGSTEACEAVLKQTPKIKDSGIEASFDGAVGKSCDDGGKKPVLYIRSGEANFTPPVELDCQPKAHGIYRIRCVNATPVLNANGEVHIVITGDSNYRSSQTGMMITFE